MCEPVLQGHARAGKTRFIYTPPAFDRLNPSPVLPNGTLEVDESFLASSLLSTELDDVPVAAAESLPSPELNGIASPLSSSSANPFAASLTSGPTCLIGALDEPVELGDAREDGETMIAMRTAELARLGLFDGSSVIVRGLSERVGRVFAADELFAGPVDALASPLWLYNLGIRSLPAEVSLRPAQARYAPPIAHSITLARICTPTSIQRQNQPLFLAALRDHFAERPRHVSLHDLITVRIDEGLARFTANEETAHRRVAPHSQRLTYTACRR